MKIIVMDCANARIDVLNVPENMVGEDVELFLVEHDYSEMCIRDRFHGWQFLQIMFRCSFMNSA